MTETSTYLVGALASHSRGKVIGQVAECEKCDQLPEDHGLTIVFGNQFQELPKDTQETWVKWCESSGRTLLLIPPYQIGETEEPLRWRTYRPDRVEVQRDASVVSKLASEIKFEFDTDLQVAYDLGGLSVSGGVNTAFFRKHPHSGLFAITGLPIWSLTVLDAKAEVARWLADLHRMAGKPQEDTAAELEPSEFVPTPDHFAVMLHLCERIAASRDEVLSTLAESPVLALPTDIGDSCLSDLERVGFVHDFRLTDDGRDTLLESSYGVYAEAMEDIQQ